MRQPCLRLPSPPQYGKLPLHFEENRGQTDARVHYLARSADRTLFFTPEGAVLSAGGAAVRIRLRGANRSIRIEGLDREPGVSNYLGPKTVAGVPASLACAIAMHGRESTSYFTETKGSWSTIFW